MLTYSFDDRGTEALYEYLYRQIKDDISNNKLKPKEKLPSKRALAKHLDISTITVENAYSQLMAEGYIYSVPRSGFYVSDISADDYKFSDTSQYKPRTYKKDAKDNNNQETILDSPKYFMDFVNNNTAPDNFPFTRWAKLIRETMAEERDNLMIKSPSLGVYQLRCAIVNYLYQFRGMDVEPEQVVVGAGTEYLYGLIIQLLGHESKYAVEDPGYQKIARIYKANKVKCVHIPLDNEGINIDALEESAADVVHITPSHHFPTGIVTPISRRHELLTWALKSEKRYIIEDDYDSEFRLLGKPIPALQSIDMSNKVIYINTFSKSLTSTIRISYMVLPKPLIERYNKELSFYACTVSNFEQYTLAKFLERGYLEIHINRMRNYYRKTRDILLENIMKRKDDKKINIMEEDAGLHFLLQVDTKISDKQLVMRAAENGINVSCLSQYYYDRSNIKDHILVINYSGVDTEYIEEGVDRLFEVF
ncbi:MAG: PLP-dependent aminotransferase family protein [Clostridiales bacterium]|nr:PLP-dependent aminotransferase family protein [Clostridiales bacterium]